jgi:hypothetical protein
MSFGTALMSMPSVMDFVQVLMDDIKRGCSVLAPFPKSVDYRPFVQILYERIRQEDYVIQRLFLPELPDISLPSAVAQSLDVSWSSKNTLRTVESLASHHRLPEVIILQQYEELTEQRRREVLAFIRRWGAVSQSVEANGKKPCALCLLLSADSLPEPPPPSELWFNTRWWWARPSALELRLLCRCMDNNVSQELGLSDQWREYVMPSLVGNDFDLANHLWNDLTQDVNHIINRLRLWAKQMQWTKDFLETWNGKGNNLFGMLEQQDGNSTVIPVALREIWAHGVVNRTPEYGTMVSPAVLAVLDQVKEIERRLWRGQVSLLLPLIDGVRLAVCEQLTTRYKPSWPIQWEEPIDKTEAAEVQRDPLATGLGHIENLLRHVDGLKRERNLISLVAHARIVRNELAHYRPVKFSDFETIWRESQTTNVQTKLRSH